ncbi:MAG: hypothetical protein MJZ30_04205 [Paludibacteraceae bacterium]|nr:hypothetical protein [Paludibacteraceae bacterium]
MKKRFYASAIMGMALAAFGLSSCEDELQEASPAQNKQYASGYEEYSLATDMMIPETSLRSGFSNNRLWKDRNGFYYIPYKFIGIATEQEKKEFKIYLLEWMSYANLNFREVSEEEDAVVRVQFASPWDEDRGNWSYVGNYAEYITDQSKPTIHFQYFSPYLTLDRWRRPLLHEMGHMLGLQHEHLSPKCPYKYDKQKVYNWAAKSQGWSKEKTDSNIFITLSGVEYTAFDAKSIMLYSLPDSCYLPGSAKAEYNNMLSDIDKQMIRQKYPFNGTKRLFRCYITNLNGYTINKHFYTTSFEELYKYSDNRFVESSMGFILDHQEAGTKPLYRFFNSKTFDHFYTANYDEYKKLRETSQSYKYEGIVGYVFSSKQRGYNEVYRLYNGKTGEHFYTTSRDEVNRCEAKGFKYERIEFYVMNDYFK